MAPTAPITAPTQSERTATAHRLLSWEPLLTRHDRTHGLDATGTPQHCMDRKHRGQKFYSLVRVYKPFWRIPPATAFFSKCRMWHEPIIAETVHWSPMSGRPRFILYPPVGIKVPWCLWFFASYIGWMVRPVVSAPQCLKFRCAAVAFLTDLKMSFNRMTIKKFVRSSVSVTRWFVSPSLLEPGSLCLFVIPTPDELHHLALIPQTALQRWTGHQPLHLAARKAQVGMQKKTKGASRVAIFKWRNSSGSNLWESLQKPREAFWNWYLRKSKDEAEQRSNGPNSSSTCGPPPATLLHLTLQNKECEAPNHKPLQNLTAAPWHYRMATLCHWQQERQMQCIVITSTSFVCKGSEVLKRFIWFDSCNTRCSGCTERFPRLHICHTAASATFACWSQLFSW